MSTKKTSAAKGAGAPKKPAAKKAVAVKKASAGAKTAKSIRATKMAVSKKKAAVSVVDYQALTVPQMCERIESEARALAIGVGDESNAYRKYLSDLLYLCYELAQFSQKDDDDGLFDGQAQVKDHLDGSKFSTLIEALAGNVDAKAASAVDAALRREEIRLAFTLRQVAY